MHVPWSTLLIQCDIEDETTLFCLLSGRRVPPTVAFIVRTIFGFLPRFSVSNSDELFSPLGDTFTEKQNGLIALAFPMMRCASDYKLPPCKGRLTLPQLQVQNVEVPRKSRSNRSCRSIGLYEHASSTWLVHAAYQGVILTWAALRKHPRDPASPPSSPFWWPLPLIRSTYLSFCPSLLSLFFLSSLSLQITFFSSVSFTL